MSKYWDNITDTEYLQTQYEFIMIDDNMNEFKYSTINWGDLNIYEIKYKQFQCSMESSVVIITPMSYGIKCNEWWTVPMSYGTKCKSNLNHNE